MELRPISSFIHTGNHITRFTSFTTAFSMLGFHRSRASLIILSLRGLAPISSTYSRCLHGASVLQKEFKEPSNSSKDLSSNTRTAPSNLPIETSPNPNKLLPRSTQNVTSSPHIRQQDAEDWTQSESSASPFSKEDRLRGSPDAFDRLQKVDLLLKLASSIQARCKECYKLYHTDGVNYMVDMSEHPRLAFELLRTAIRLYRRSGSMRAFVLDQLLKALLSGQFQSAKKFIKIMLKLKALPQETAVIANDAINFYYAQENDIQSVPRFVELLVHMALSEGEVLISALLVLQAHEKNIVIGTDLIENMCLALAVDSSTMRNYNSYTIFKILDVFGIQCLSAGALLQVMCRILENPYSCYYANLLYDKILYLFQDGEINSEFQEASLLLIQRNLDCGNFHRAAGIWTQLCASDASFATNHTPIAILLLKSSPNIESSMNILKQDNQKTDPDLVDYLLAFYGQNQQFRKEYDELVKTLKPPLRRSTLSLLFASFLNQNNEVAAERILQALFSTQQGLTPDDFNAISQTLLRQHKVKKMIAMCSNTDVQTSKRGIIRVWEYLSTYTQAQVVENSDLPTNEYSKAKATFMSAMSRRLTYLRESDPTLREFTISLIKYLSTSVSNGAARKLYINYAYLSFLSPSSLFHFASFQLQEGFHKLIKIDATNRVQCISTILERAKQEKDQETVTWCLSELSHLGIPAVDIKQYYMD